MSVSGHVAKESTTRGITLSKSIVYRGLSCVPDGPVSRRISDPHTSSSDVSILKNIVDRCYVCERCH